MNSVETVKSGAYKALPRGHAEELAERAGLTLNAERHPDLRHVEGLQEFGGSILLESFDADAYYSSTLAWYRSHDRAKVHVLTHFENRCGRLPDEIREKALHSIGHGQRWQGLCGRDAQGQARFLPVGDEEGVREVKLTPAQAEAYERRLKRGGLAEVPRLA
jgi:hypothetical protein